MKLMIPSKNAVIYAMTEYSIPTKGSQEEENPLQSAHGKKNQG